MDVVAVRIVWFLFFLWLEESMTHSINQMTLGVRALAYCATQIVQRRGAHHDFQFYISSKEHDLLDSVHLLTLGAVKTADP